MGHSHAIYNATDKPVQWININVSMLKGEYDNFDLNNKREMFRSTRRPMFMTMTSTAPLLRQHQIHFTAEKARHNTGERSMQPCSRLPGLSSITFCCRQELRSSSLLPGCGAVLLRHGRRGHRFSFCTRTAGNAAIRTGDAVPIQLSEVHPIENNGTQPLELMAVGVARDTHKELEYVDASPGAPRQN